VQRRNPALRCVHAKSDEVLAAQIERAWQANMQVYGAQKIWRRMFREGIEIARCTPFGSGPSPVQGAVAQSTLVSDFTYVSTWQGCVHMAFVIDFVARCIVGWRVSQRCAPTSSWMF